MLIPCNNKDGVTCMMTNIKTPTMTLFTGLLKIKMRKTSVEIAEMIVPLVSDQFTMTTEVTTELLIQLSAYFEHKDIHNEEYISFMTKYVN